MIRPARSQEKGFPEGGCSPGKPFYSVVSPEQFWGHMCLILMASWGLSPRMMRLGTGCLHPSLPTAVWLHEGSARRALCYATNHCSEEK